MSNCENYKRPRQLGLSIHTSDVSLYDGESLNCLNTPDNPDLNDVIESIDERICQLIELINNASNPTVTVPNDDWVELTNSDMTVINYTGTAGGTPEDRDMDISFMYKVISEDAALVKCNVRLSSPITALTDFVQFNFRFPAISGSNWFVGTKQMTTTNVANTKQHQAPVSIVAIDGLGGTYSSKGRVEAFSGGGITNLFSVGYCQPNISSNDYIFEISFDLICKLI